MSDIYPKEISDKFLELPIDKKPPWECENLTNQWLRVIQMRRMQDAGVPHEQQRQLWGRYWCVNENDYEEQRGTSEVIESVGPERFREWQLESANYWDNDVQNAINDAREARKSKFDTLHIVLTVIAVIAAVIASINSCDNSTSSAQSSPQNTNESELIYVIPFETHSQVVL